MALTTKNGLSIPTEVVLMIIESMEYEPGMLENIMCISRQFRELIKYYEAPLCTYFSSTLNASFTPLRASRVALDHPLQQPQTFGWLAECYTRSLVLRDLKQDGYCSTMHRLYRNSGLCVKGFNEVIGPKTFIGMDLMFRVFDAHREGLSRHDAQLALIPNLSQAELAHIRLLTHGLATKYTAELLEQYKFANPDAYADASMETSSFVREMLLYHGPHFIWAGLHGTAVEKEQVKNYICHGRELIRDADAPLTNPLVTNDQDLESRMIKEFRDKAEIPQAPYWEAMADIAVRDFVDSIPSSPCEGREHGMDGNSGSDWWLRTFSELA